MRLTTKKGRLFAFKLRAKRNKRSNRKCWFVGLTTRRYFWLDLNTPKYFKALYLAILLKERLQTKVFIFKTNKSFWLVTKKILTLKEWRREYAFWLNNFKKTVCQPFCLCSLKYDKTTLRVSNKKGRRPKLVRVVIFQKDGVRETVKPFSHQSAFTPKQRATLSAINWAHRAFKGFGHPKETI